MKFTCSVVQYDESGVVYIIFFYIAVTRYFYNNERLHSIDAYLVPQHSNP